MKTMSKFTLFLVHGIGIHHDSNWAQETIAMLEKAWGRDVIINSSGSRMVDHVEVVPIT
jgi:hypothetical protein